MKVYVLDAFHRAGVDYARQHADVVSWDDPRVAGWHQDADAVMVRLVKIGAADFARAKALKVVSKQGVGIENIDLEAARAHGVTVCNTPGANREAVAEMALTLGLAVSRRIAEMDRTIRAGGTIQRQHFLGYESWGKTIGIVGMGNIGTSVARKWHAAFDARLIGYDPYVPADRWSELPHERVASLDELLRRADLVSVHVPLTAETRGMIGARELGLMQPHAVVINTARGGIVDEAALYQALRDGRIFGAGLDVLETEPPTVDTTRLVSLPNVVVTPHAAAGTFETQAKTSLMVGRQLIDVLQGRPPLHRVV